MPTSSSVNYSAVWHLDTESNITARKISGLTAIIVFLGFAAVQYDDSDGLLWMGIYGYAAWLSWLWTRRPVRRFAVVGLAMYAACLVYWPPKFPPDWIQVQAAREAAGLLICLIWMMILWFSSIPAKVMLRFR